MASFVKEDRQADWRLRIRRFDPIDDLPVVVVDAPGAAAHTFSPAPDAQVVTGFDFFYDRAEVHTKRDIGKSCSGSENNAQNAPAAARDLRRLLR